MDFIRKTGRTPSSAKTMKPRTPGVTLFSSRALAARRDGCQASVMLELISSIVADAGEQVVLGHRARPPWSGASS